MRHIVANKPTTIKETLVARIKKLEFSKKIIGMQSKLLLYFLSSKLSIFFFINIIIRLGQVTTDNLPYLVLFPRFIDMIYILFAAKVKYLCYQCGEHDFWLSYFFWYKDYCQHLCKKQTNISGTKNILSLNSINTICNNFHYSTTFLKAGCMGL